MVPFWVNWIGLALTGVVLLIELARLGAWIARILTEVQA